VTARALVNAAGPWAGALLGLLTPNSNERRLRLVKGSHIVMPRLYPGDHAFLLQGRDGRVVFAIPFEQHFTLVGTTDVDCYGPPDDPAISKPEVEYLLDTISRTFTAQVSSRDIVWSFAGIRALNDVGAGPAPKATREYALDLDAPEKTAPLLNVFGGKLTTYRRLSERAVDRLSEYFMNVGPPWTERACLPGGDIPNANIAAYAGRLAHNCPSLRPALIARLVRTYGARTAQLLDGVRSTRDLGECFGADLYAREVEYLVSHEWARSPQDILFRRTKLGLRIGSEGAERLTAFLPLSD
jgi:glycerol-3-phosphate dehydrogenase